MNFKATRIFAIILAITIILATILLYFTFDIDLKKYLFYAVIIDIIIFILLYIFTIKLVNRKIEVILNKKQKD